MDTSKWVFSPHPPTLGEMADLADAREGDLRALIRWIAARFQRSYKECRNLTAEELLPLMQRATEGLVQVVADTKAQETQEVAALKRQIDLWMQQMKEPPHDC